MQTINNPSGGGIAEFGKSLAANALGELVIGAPKQNVLTPVPDAGVVRVYNEMGATPLCKVFEEGGIAKHDVKLVMAVACARVPKFTVIVGGSFGAGNYGMCGRGYDPCFLFMWPNAHISVMGGEQAAGVLATIKPDQIESKNRQWTEQQEAEYRRPILETYQTQGHPYYASARLWDDGVIEPNQTRKLLVRCMEIARNSPPEDTRFGVFRM